jgi:hypothetical protein
MDWIGVPGLDPTWVPPACYKEIVLNDPAGKHDRALVIQPPNICVHISPEQYREATGNPDSPGNREIIERYQAQIALLKWLKTTCVNKLMVHTTDASLIMAREAGWSPDELVLTIHTGGDIVDTMWYIVDEHASEYWYRARYDCGLLRKDGNWYRIPDFMQRHPDDTPEQVKEKYNNLSRIETDPSASTDSLPLASGEEVRSCVEKLLTMYLRRLYENLWRSAEVIPLYAIYMDEPFKQGNLINPQFRGTVMGLYDAIRKGRDGKHVYFIGDGYETYFGVGGFDSLWQDVRNVAGLGDFVFSTKYKSDEYIGPPFPYFHPGTSDQSRDWYYWKSYKPEVFEKTRGAWVHLFEDDTEFVSLVHAAIDLEWRDIYLFSHEEAHWKRYGDDWRRACNEFRARVEFFCNEISLTHWIEHDVLRYGYLYCKYYPECRRCDKNREEDWLVQRPEWFPVVDRGPARYLPGYEPEHFLGGATRLSGESDR